MLSLAKARAKAKDALLEVANGVDPAEVKQQRRDADTMTDLTTQYLAWAEENKRSWVEDKRRINKYVLPAWKHRAVASISRRDVKHLLASIAAPVECNRVHTLVSRLFSYAVDEEVIDVHPIARMKKLHQEASRSRVLSYDEIRVFWAATEDMPSTMRAAFRLRLITAQRGKEVVHLRWQDVDLVTGWWTIPSEYRRTNCRIACRCRHWPSIRSKRYDRRLTRTRSSIPMRSQRCSPSKGLAGNGNAGVHQRCLLSRTSHHMTCVVPAATYMTSSGIPRLVVQKVLNHAEQGITSVYDRASYRYGKTSGT